MSVEIDQSGKLEQLNTHTVIACANHKALAIFITASSKRKIIRTIRKSIVPRRDLLAIVFGICVFILLIKAKIIQGRVVIDEEYSGKEKIIKETITKLFEKARIKWQGSLIFKQVGKHSPAHSLAWKIHRNKKLKDVEKIAEQDILKWWQ